MKESDPSALEYLSVTENVYTHYTFERHGHIIHLVILYSRPAGYWWHGQITGDMITFSMNNTPEQHTYLKLNDSFIREGAYDM